MADPNGATPTLERLVDVAAQLQRDRDRSGAELRARDRQIGRRLQGGRRARALDWLDQVWGAEPRPGQTALAARLWLTTALVAIGLLLGAATARVVYDYDGSKPVNIIEVLAFFVGLQLLLVVLTAIAMLPAPWRRRVPGVSGLQDALGILSPGRWQAGLARILPQTQRDSLALVLGRGVSHGKLFGGVQQWAVLLGSQSFGLAFHTGALATCLALVSFTDLAFGWSTTLELEPATLHRVTDVLSAPWAAFAPDARPSIELIDATRYFRLGRGSLPGSEGIDAVDPASLGGWWPFCAASMIVYGLLPRMLFWVVAQRRLSSEVTRAFDRLPGLVELYERLEHPWVQTAAADPEVQSTEANRAAAPGRNADLERRSIVVVNWSGVDLNDANLETCIAELLHTGVARVEHAGGSRSWAQDRETVGAIAGSDGVAVAVRAWEPPVLEFVDFAVELRAALGDAVPIVVLPLALDAAGAPAAPADSDLAQWSRRIESVGDPWLSVRALERAP
jgi:hypothetical protein